MTQSKPHLKFSVSLKFVLLFLSMAVLLDLTVLSSAGWLLRTQPAIRHSAQQVVEFFADSVYRHPTFLKDRNALVAFSKQIGLDIQVELPGHALFTTDSSLPIQTLREVSRPVAEKQSIRAGRYGDGRFFFIAKTNDYEMVFITPPGHWVQKQPVILAGWFGIISIVLLLSFFVARYVLSPLKPLMLATQRFKEGDLKHRISFSSRDEFEELAVSFNEMAENLESMIHNKEQLLLDVSHELRSPLTRMNVAIELMPENPKKQHLLEDIREMDSMISDLLEAQRLKNPYGSLHLEEIELDDLVRQQAERYAERRPGAVFVETAQPIVLRADPKRITTLVRNLIENAQKYSLENSSPVEISVVLQDSQVILHVRDYGPGIPEAEIEKVFEPFYRIDKSRTRSTGGYGLGLPLCRKIVEAHGGTLTLRNAPEGGILAEVKLPLTPPVL